MKFRIATKSIATSRSFFLLFAWLIFAAASPGQKTPLAAPLDLDCATFEQLEQLPGGGPTIGRAMVRFREKSGPLKRVEDRLAVRSVSKNKLEKLRPYVFVNPPPKKLPSSH
jgi:DNA uptake protein ComE-like DNA-binding protein